MGEVLGFVKLYKILKHGQIVKSPHPGLYAGVKTSKIFGQTKSKCAWNTKKKNLVFFHFWDDALREGYRSCMRCKPVRLVKEEKALEQKIGK